jgi:putative N6-adenine-specific DNA methylase
MDDRTDTNAFNKRLRRHIGGRVRAYFAVTAPGIEAWCHHELVALGLGRDAAVVPGGVTFNGRFVDCQRANLHLRTATRILMRIDEFSATNERQLKKKVACIPWVLFLPANPAPEINVRSRQSRLYHTKMIANAIRTAISGRISSSLGSDHQMASQTIFVRAVHDRFTLSLDSSGAALYKRGLKEGPARAPIRETLAATILMVAGYNPHQPLADSMCGSGTFSLEAAMQAKRIAAGMNRSFAFMQWPVFNDSQWVFLKKEAQRQVLGLSTPRIFASDIDARACSRLTDVIRRNHLSDAVRVDHQDFFASTSDAYGSNPGLVVINPPYGIRLGSGRQADALFTNICRHLVQAFRGWTVAIVTPRRVPMRQLPFPARRMALAHGGLRLNLIIGSIQ